jgi:hypothetical protein
MQIKSQVIINITLLSAKEDVCTQLVISTKHTFKTVKQKLVKTAVVATVGGITQIAMTVPQLAP